MFFRRRSGIKTHWRRLYKKSLTELNELIEQDYPWRDWEANVSPDTLAEFDFKTAIRILAGSDNWDLARRYMTRSVEIVNRTIEEKKLMAPGCNLNYPANSARCRRIKAYAHSLLGGALDTEALILASKEFEAHYEKHDAPDNRNEQNSYHWIDSIHLSLIGDDLERSMDLLSRPPARAGYNERHFGVLESVLQLALGQVPTKMRPHIADRFETFFDWARDPRKKARGHEHLRVTIGPLELALLRDKYIARHDRLDWKRVIADYSK